MFSFHSNAITSLAVTLLFCLVSTSSSAGVRTPVAPSRIILQGGKVQNAGQLLKSECSGQAVLSASEVCVMENVGDTAAFLLLDYGKELHGGVQIVTSAYGDKTPARVRIRFGESVSEACCDIDGKNGATNDHAIRDFEATLPWMGVREFGNSGFRFVRIDLLDKNVKLNITEINAIRVESDIPQIGSFRCSDQRLNEIWETGRRTVKLNMQDYIWDGIKRDRLVWVGDMYPEVMTVCNVYGGDSIIPRSLDHSIRNFPLPSWINGISSYSIWWLLIQDQWYRYTGDREYLLSQKDYLTGVLAQLRSAVDENGNEHLGGMRFLDWPSQADKEATDTGLHALMMIGLERGEYLSKVIGDDNSAALCRDTYLRLKGAAKGITDKFIDADVSPDRAGRKQAVALMTLAGMIDDDTAAESLLYNDSHGFSTFYGYFMLEALAKIGRYEEAMDIIREYWGAMIELGATSFWEDFDIDWVENAGRIDELPREGEVDVHQSYGGYCYQGYRHSLCHGWASGPTAWLSRYVLGLEPFSAGQNRVSVNPHLGSLQWAEGSYPTPYGTVQIRVEKEADGGVVAKVKAPRGVKLVPGEGVTIARLK